MTFYTSALRYKNTILHRGYDENGVRFSREEYFEPTLYNKTNRNTPFKDIHGANLMPIIFNNFWECKKYVEENQTFDNTICGTSNYATQFLFDRYSEDFNYQLDKVHRVKIDIETTCENGFPDIEKADETISVLTISSSKTGKKYVFGLKPEAFTWEYDKDNPDNIFSSDDPFVIYKDFSSEIEMLKTFLIFWQRLDADIITGWNIEGFDIPFLVNRITKLLGSSQAQKLSPWGRVESKTTYIMNQEKQTYKIQGVAILDYLQLYEKFIPVNRSSYKLDYICELELGKKKLSYDEYGEMHIFYKKNYAKFVKYNIIDVVRIDELDEKLKLLDLAIYLAYYSKVNFEQVYSPVAVIESLMYNHLMERNIVTPLKKISSNDLNSAKIRGGYVKEPLVGKHEWVVSFDYNSLYPSIIMQQNISPETLVEDKFTYVDEAKFITGEFKIPHQIIEDDEALCATGYHFSKNKTGFLPEIIRKLYSERKADKAKMLEYASLAQITKDPEEKKKYEILSQTYDVIQNVKKVLLNSMYGALANKYFLFFDNRMAESITVHGQFIIQRTALRMNEYLNKTLKTDKDRCVTCDTDSGYFCLADLVDIFFDKEEQKNNPEKIIDFLDNVCEQKISKILDNISQEIFQYTNAYENHLVMKRECLTSRAVWRGGKNYALVVWDQEGVRYKEPKLKDMGLETAKSSTPDFIRKALKESIMIAMTKEEEDLKKFATEFKETFMKSPIEDISFPKGVSFVDKYKDGDDGTWITGTPINSKAAIIYNHYLDKYDLSKKYDRIKDGDKMKYVLLKTPNPTHEKLIGFLTNFPKEFELDEYINKELMFEKMYTSPLESIIQHMNWSLTDTSQSIESFFL